MRTSTPIQQVKQKCVFNTVKLELLWVSPVWVECHPASVCLVFPPGSGWITLTFLLCLLTSLTSDLSTFLRSTGTCPICFVMIVFFRFPSKKHPYLSLISSWTLGTFRKPFRMPCLLGWGHTALHIERFGIADHPSQRNFGLISKSFRNLGEPLTEGRGLMV